MGTITIRKKSNPNTEVVLESNGDGGVRRSKRLRFGGLNEPPLKKVPSRQVLPRPPVISLSEPGRLRIANLLWIFGVSRTTLHVGVKSGRYPKPDGLDGRIPYWNTATVASWLSKK